jgi:hypothetical protein
MVRKKDTEPDVEKIKKDLAASASSARKKAASAAKAYQEEMARLTEQLRKTRSRDKD